MQHFAYYNKANFDLWPKKKKFMLKSGIPNMIPEKNVLLVIDGLREKKCFSSKKIFYLKHNLRHNK